MGWGFQLLFTLSSQLIGIAFAGMFRRFLVWPSAMIWPNQFSNISLFFALHDKRKSTAEEANGWQISRYRYFLYVMLGAFVWYWYVVKVVASVPSEPLLTKTQGSRSNLARTLRVRIRDL